MLIVIPSSLVHANDWQKSFNNPNSSNGYPITSGSIKISHNHKQNYVIACEKPDTGEQYMPRHVFLNCTDTPVKLIGNDSKYPMQVARKNTKGNYQLFGFFVKNTADTTRHLEIKLDCSNAPGDTRIPEFTIEKKTPSSKDDSCGGGSDINIKEYTGDHTYDLIPCEFCHGKSNCSCGGR
tara:strand:+ start:1259 stop:1798 length:540 start_codon:yes stop_codon:yes gene_type:complete